MQETFTAVLDPSENNQFCLQWTIYGNHYGIKKITSVRLETIGWSIRAYHSIAADYQTCIEKTLMSLMRQV